jgi:hypothetical protein
LEKIMAVVVEDVTGLAKAFVDTVGRLGPKERDRQPSAALGENHNHVLQLAQESMSGIDPRLWPKPVEVYEGATGGRVTKGTHGNPEICARQLLHLLPTTM